MTRQEMSEVRGVYWLTKGKLVALRERSDWYGYYKLFQQRRSQEED
jgi:hypothetical protein